ncbi:XRN 5'-3' exonuclease N-terminus family protein [Histomonas meleagridis]|uniref:XRN 5'-3' exonuclease N-terminus family protein n=1 Tax=Histomonas meleagridis TaxID=135588 RepID=UPI003559F284|nr:XRN 5'-3' exonuclease N-terminus family protein [Histomonas meleagridis]KAH0799470.1 XRN 5'-3' exonuclease N-terminus family protein [Histomonas meleagridis]
MGVPAFFKWLQRKYPAIISNCIEKKSDRDSSKPNPNTEGDREFDCLYLDMNGIIHPCFHPDGVAPPRSEEEIFDNIDRYILRVFNIVRPRMLLFMAIDGVAPRAKMNQQRMRRYRSAKDNAYKLIKMKHDAEENNDTAELEILNDPDYLKKHDSNVITPGSPFFERLTTHLRSFIAKQQRDDPGWHRIMVILSDASVPGEGEHKIMSFIRSQRIQPKYDPNCRHVIYGLDADLIFLGLASHEPYFFLLRENVIDMSGEKNPEREDIGPEFFHFVSLWVLRQYLERDLQPPNLRFQWDFENALDDFIFLCFGAGNDFIPSIPGFSIHSGAIQAVISTYRRLLPKLGYLTQNGAVNIPAFSQIMKEFDKGEVKGLETILYPSPQAKEAQEYVNKISNTDNPVYCEKEKDEEQKRQKPNQDAPLHSIKELKPMYYCMKFQFDADVYMTCVPKVVTEYAKGMVWILNYYLHGVPSWNWYYPYHYAPLASDFDTIDLDPKNFQFELSEPFKPLEQLMAVLPPQSAHCLPPVMKYLMTDPKSELHEFYPTKFTVDLGGSTATWHGVVHVPFIDEVKMKKVLEKSDLSLTADEIKRNTFGKTKIFVHKDLAPPKHLETINLNRPSFGKMYRIQGIDYDKNVSCEFEFEFPHVEPNQFMSYLNRGVVFPPSAIEHRHNLNRYDAFYDRGTIDEDTFAESVELPLQIPGYLPGTTMNSRSILVQKMKFMHQNQNDQEQEIQERPPPMIDSKPLGEQNHRNHPNGYLQRGTHQPPMNDGYDRRQPPHDGYNQVQPPYNGYDIMQPPVNGPPINNNYDRKQPPYDGYNRQQPPYGGYGGNQPPYNPPPPMNDSYDRRQPPYNGYDRMQPPVNGNYDRRQQPYDGYNRQQPPYGGYQNQPPYNQPPINNGYDRRGTPTNGYNSEQPPYDRKQPPHPDQYQRMSQYPPNGYPQGKYQQPNTGYPPY